MSNIVGKKSVGMSERQIKSVIESEFNNNLIHENLILVNVDNEII